MKQYEAPELVCYGSLSQVTAFDTEDSPEDFYYYSETPGDGIPGTGSEDGCVSADLEACDF